MTCSYRVDPFGESPARKRVTVTLSTEHSQSSYGQPVMVLPDGGVLDLMSWVGCGYRIERATAKEREAVARILGTLAFQD
ncbi:hypothetical protein DNFV4_02836 [Nitrospira tepida]|mgnify:CR=1 FL=1|uniref:Uncharacterized protein n=1 Tax=Nitrospira tepida TaxID=2973512 RepID=A0AA86N0R6_9BACT|nr:hypothetical protein [Nitrospira tepida]CAI4032406.1 hypothetical protein DNFV4_02836 [Nitrospira tepida]